MVYSTVMVCTAHMGPFVVPDQTVGGKVSGLPRPMLPVALSAATIQGLSFVLLGLCVRIQADPNQV